MEDSMILRGDLPPLVSGWGLCDIIKVRFRVTQKKNSKIGSPESGLLTRWNQSDISTFA